MIKTAWSEYNKYYVVWDDDGRSLFSMHGITKQNAIARYKHALKIRKGK